MAGPAAAVAIGDKVVTTTTGLLGTVRYVGTTNFTKGLWIGLELHDPGERTKVQKLHNRKSCFGNRRACVALSALAEAFFVFIFFFFIILLCVVTLF